MKRIICGIIPLVMFFIGCDGGTKSVENSIGMTLDQAIKKAAIRIDERIAARSKIALLNFSSPSDRFSSYVLDELEANLLDSGQLTVVDRKEVNLIRNELKFQFSDEVGDDSIQNVGRMLGAQSIVSGSLTKIGNSYRIVIRVLNVQSAAVEAQYRTDIVADSRVLALLEGGRSGGTKDTQQQTSTNFSTRFNLIRNQIVNRLSKVFAKFSNHSDYTNKTPPSQTAKINQISIGIKVIAKQAGTVYFEGTQITNLWANEEYTIPVNEPGVYTVTMKFANGSETTRMVEINSRKIVTLILDVEYKIGDTGPAGGIVFYDKTSYSDGWRYLEAAPASNEIKASWDTCVQMTDVLVINGINKWRLPTRDELNWMFTNLKKKGLGEFSDDVYWSSETIWGWAARAIRFSNGEWLRSPGLVGDDMGVSKSNTLSSRAVRTF